MSDTLTAWAAAIWTALAFFVSSNIEPSSGVIVASFFGAALSSMTGPDRDAGRAISHFLLGLAVGVFASQIIAEFITLKTPQFRVGQAFFCALFAEKIVAGIHSGSILAFISSIRAGGK